MSEGGLQPMATRFKAVNMPLAINEAYSALWKMFPDIQCDTRIGDGDYQVSFGMRNRETFYEFLTFLHEATNVNLIPKKIICNPPATVVLWNDGTKTVVKCSEEDEYVPEVGFLWALAEKVYGNKSRLDKVMGRWLTDGE